MIVHQILVDMEERASTPTMDITAGCILDVILPISYYYKKFCLIITHLTLQYRCPDEWEGPTCDIDVNECEEFEHTDLGCKNGATCQNTPGGYR